MLLPRTSLVLSQTVRSFLNNGSALIEITRTTNSFLVALVDLPSGRIHDDIPEGLYEHRNVYKWRVFEAPLVAEEIYLWLRENSFWVTQIEPGTIEAMLETFPTEKL